MKARDTIPGLHNLWAEMAAKGGCWLMDAEEDIIQRPRMGQGSK